MPIGDPNADRDKYDLFVEIYEDIIVPSVKRSGKNLDCVRGDEIRETGNIVRDIISYLYDAELVIADLTGKNPNVFYELGVRQTFGKPTILISQTINDVPFDLRAYRTLIYGLSPRSIKRFESELVTTINNVFVNEKKPDNPIADFLQPSRLNAIVNSFGMFQKDMLHPSEITIKNIEENLSKLQENQETLKSEVTALMKQKSKVAKGVEEISKSRASLLGRNKKDNLMVPNVSGVWHGQSGRLKIIQDGAKITGDYDWNGYDMAGHISGELEGMIIKFKWRWDKSSENGNGFFMCDDKNQSLKGSWFMDFEEINLDEAIEGEIDMLLHPWAFIKSASG